MSSPLPAQVPTGRSVAEGLSAALSYRPLAVLTVVLVAGIAIAEQRSAWLAVAAVGCGLIIAAPALARRGLRWAPLLPLALLAGLALHTAANTVPRSDLSLGLEQAPASLVGIVTDLDRRPTGARLTLRLLPRQSGYSGAVRLRSDGQLRGIEPGDTVRAEVSGLCAPRRALNPGQFDRRRYLERKGIRTEAKVTDLQVISRPRLSMTRLRAWSQVARDRKLATFRELMPGADGQLYADILAGMVYGVRATEPLPAQIEDLYRRTGTYHLLVVSGAQISLIIAALVFLVTGGLSPVREGGLLRRRWALAPWHIAVIAPALLAYALLTGLGPSVSRSMVTALLVVYAMVTGRRHDIPTALALTALALVLVDPNVVFDIGAQLSFAATIGVVAFLPRVRTNEAGVRVRPGLLAQVALGSLGAWVATTPIMAHHFAGVAALGALANLVAVPVSILVLPLGMAALITGSWFPAATVTLCALGQALIRLTIASNAIFAALPGAYADVIWFSGWHAVVWYVLVGGGGYALLHGIGGRSALLYLREAARSKWALPAAAATSALFATSGAAGVWRADELRFDLLAVGDGQCAVIRARDRAIMVDAGSDLCRYSDAALLADGVIIPYLVRQGIRRLDAIVISHPHADHCGAVPRMLERVRVGCIVAQAVPEPSDTWREIEESAQRKGVPIRIPAGGDRLLLGGGVEATLLVVGQPPRGPASSKATNNASVALRVSGPGPAFLLLGDLQQEGITRLLKETHERGLILRSDVVVLPHHGRDIGPLESLLAQACPRWQLISAADARAITDPPQAARVAATDDRWGMLTIRARGANAELRSFVTGRVDRWRTGSGARGPWVEPERVK